MDFYSTLPDSVRASLRQFEEEYVASLRSTSKSLNYAIDHLLEVPGKRLRPMVIILAAGSFGATDSRVVQAAIFLEMLHTATLVHDDVIDGSDQRRGKPSMKALIGNAKAVLLGDYILSEAFLRALNSEDFTILSMLAELGKSLAEGEFLQADASEKGGPTEAEYYRIINKKTASLIAVCVEMGVRMAGVSDPDAVTELKAAGTNLGIAFQIKDDLLDYSLGEVIGKPTGQDLLERKVTLPLVYALTQEHEQQGEMRALLLQETLTQADVECLVAFARDAGGVDYARAVMEQLIEGSKALFAKWMPENEYSEALQRLCDYVGTRHI